MANMSENTPMIGAERVVLTTDAGRHIDAYSEYFSLVGNTDNGVPLSAKEFATLKKRAIDAKRNELFVFWRNAETGVDCKSIGPASSCLCGHRFREHAWYETETKQVKCRMRACRCRCFEYLPVHGSRSLFCRCKHNSECHDPESRVCKPVNKACSCKGFHSTMRCSCNDLWEKHKTVFENKEERMKMGKPVDRLFDSIAPAGGITSHLSLADGVDREFSHRIDSEKLDQ